MLFRNSPQNIARVISIWRLKVAKNKNVQHDLAFFLMHFQNLLLILSYFWLSLLYKKVLDSQEIVFIGNEAVYLCVTRC